MEFNKIIGKGKTGTVYEWEDGKVLKLFNKDYPNQGILKEFNNAKAIENMNFAKPKVYETVYLEGQIGIVYDRVDGESLLALTMRTGDLEGCAAYMAELHKSILQNSIDNVPYYKDFLKYNISSSSSLPQEIKEETLETLNKLPDGDTLCHGDFHPDNILISNEQAVVIDFMNICRGTSLYDVARTLFLIQYTPVPTETEDKEKLMKLKKALADLYLDEMKVTREMIHDYLSVIIAARGFECP